MFCLSRELVNIQIKFQINYEKKNLRVYCQNRDLRLFEFLVGRFDSNIVDGIGIF